MYKLITTLILSTLSLQTFATTPQSIDDFAYSATLSEAKTSLRQVDLPLSVYEQMQRKDYGDLRIFSADGQIVPHQFTHPEKVDSTQLTPLVFYPFSKKEAANPSNIQIVISQNQKSGKQRLSINQQLRNGTKSKNKEYQYIIENPEDSPSLCTLRLDWQQSKPSSILPFKLESGNKLQNWKTLSRQLTVSKLNYGSSQLIHNEVSFPCSTHKYLRLTWLKPEQNTHLKKIHAIYTQKGELKTQWKSLNKPHYDEKGNWLFESNVVAALSTMEFVAPHDGLLYKGTLYSRNNEKQTWRYRKEISQYQLNIGETNLQSSAFSLTPNSDRYWKVVLKNEGRFTENQLPNIRVGWMPKQLHFMAQGKDPFQLAFGNSRIKPAQYNDLKTLVESIKQSGANIDKVSIRTIINNDKILKAESKTPWKLILLWLVLILGTALMAFMAYRLFTQMNKEEK